MKNEILHAVKWSALCEVTAKIISPISTMILARILAQEVFGIIASLTAITSLADLLTDAGFNAYIVQHEFKNASEKEQVYNIAFWSNLILSLLSFMLITVNRYFFAQLVGAQGYEKALSVACIVIPLTSISSIELAIMKRNLEFKSIGIIRIISKVIPLLITVPLALLGFSYWSLIIGNLLGESVNIILCIKFGKLNPGLYYNIQTLKKILDFSAWAYLESILEWLLSNIAIFTVGAVYGVYYLGIFKTGINIISQILMSVYALYANVYKAAIAKEQNNLKKFKNVFLSFQRYTSILSIPLGIGTFLYREFITGIMLGEKWGEAVNLIGMWGLVTMFSISFGNFFSDAVRAKGYPRKLVIVDSIYLASLLILLRYVGENGLEFDRFCLMYCLLKLVQPLLQIFIGIRTTKIKLIQVIRNCFPQLAASAVMAAAILLFQFSNLSKLKALISIFFCIIIYFIVFYMITPDKKKFRGFWYNKIVRRNL